MTEIIASPGRVINIGYEGEDNVTLIQFRYDSDWLSHGDGVFKVRVKRPCDAEAYNATQIVDDREAMTLTMTVTDIELSVKGHGEMQVVFYGADFVKKSPIYRYNVSRAIDSEVVNPPQGSIINELVQSVGDLDELTTTDKSSLVSAINEVNQQGGGSITVDDALSGVSENPVQNKVVKDRFDGLDQTVAGIGGRLSTAETALEGKANTADVNSALSAKADKSYVDTELSGKANSTDIAIILTNVTEALSGIETALEGKASTDVATTSSNGLMSAQDKTKLDGLGNSGVSDVQVNGTSVVSNGVAEIPIAGANQLGLVKKVNPAKDGINITNEGTLSIYGATAGHIKSGASAFLPIVAARQHEATFYGLAKVAGHDEKNSTLPAGTYTEEAKTAIRTMLGLEEMYQWYKSNSGN